MANRYFIASGATANWNDVNSWSETSGGVVGASIPTSSDNAIFDANSLSAPCNLTINAVANCLDLDFSGLDNLLTLTNSAYDLNVYGNLTLTSNTYLATAFSGTGYLQLRATTSVNITSNGCTRGWNRIWLDGNAGIFNFIDNFNTPTILYPSLGTANFGSSTHSFAQIRKQNGSTSFTLNLEASTVTTSQIWSDGGTFSLNAGTSSVTITGALALPRTYYNLTLSGSVSVWFTGTVVQNTLTLTSTSGRAFIYSNYLGTSQTITCNGTIVASNVDVRDITLAGTANRDLSAITGGSGDCGGNSGITFTPAANQYFKHSGTSTVNWSDTTKWFTTSGGSVQGRVPLPQDDAIFDANSFDANCKLNVNVPRIGGLNMEGVDQAVSIDEILTNYEHYKGVRLLNNVSFLTYKNHYFYGTGTYELAWPNSFLYNIYVLRGTYTLVGNIKGYSIHFTTGTLNCGEFSILAESNSTGGSVTIGSAFTFNAENGTVRLSQTTGAAFCDLTATSKALNKVSIAGGGTGDFRLNSIGSIKELIVEAGNTVSLVSNQSVEKITSLGAPSNKIRLKTNVGGVARTINYTGLDTPFIPNAVLKDINFSVPVYALNGTNLGNNTNVKYVWKVAKKTMGFPIRLVKDE